MALRNKLVRGVLLFCRPELLTRDDNGNGLPDINVLGISQSDRGQGALLNYKKQDDHGYQSGNQKGLSHRDLWQ